LYAKNIQIELLKKTNPLAYKKAREIEAIQKQILQSKDGDIVYCLISGSVDVDYLKKVVFEISSLTPNTNTKLVFVAQGFFSDKLMTKYNLLQKELLEYDCKELFQSNTRLIADPALFKKYNVKKVPVLMYGIYKNSTYSSDSEIKYIARGDILPSRFFHLISTKDSSFEKYTNIISLLY
jgi:hypothetical protein